MAYAVRMRLRWRVAKNSRYSGSQAGVRATSAPVAVPFSDPHPVKSTHGLLRFPPTRVFSGGLEDEDAHSAAGDPPQVLRVAGVHLARPREHLGRLLLG